MMANADKVAAEANAAAIAPAIAPCAPALLSLNWVLLGERLGFSPAIFWLA